jgi:hypothetical protein
VLRHALNGLGGSDFAEASILVSEGNVDEEEEGEGLLIELGLQLGRGRLDLFGVGYMSLAVEKQAAEGITLTS